jgi:hypothetical protein
MARNADSYSFVLMIINPEVLMKLLFLQRILLTRGKSDEISV